MPTLACGAMVIGGTLPEGGRVTFSPSCVFSPCVIAKARKRRPLKTCSRGRPIAAGCCSSASTPGTSTVTGSSPGSRTTKSIHTGRPICTTWCSARISATTVPPASSSAPRAEDDETQTAIRAGSLVHMMPSHSIHRMVRIARCPVAHDAHMAFRFPVAAAPGRKEQPPDHPLHSADPNDNCLTCKRTMLDPAADEARRRPGGGSENADHRAGRNDGDVLGCGC